MQGYLWNYKKFLGAQTIMQVHLARPPQWLALLLTKQIAIQIMNSQQLFPSGAAFGTGARFYALMGLLCGRELKFVGLYLQNN